MSTPQYVTPEQRRHITREFVARREWFNPEGQRMIDEMEQRSRAEDKRLRRERKNKAGNPLFAKDTVSMKDLQRAYAELKKIIL